MGRRINENVAVQAFLIEADIWISVGVSIIFIAGTPLWLYQFTNIKEQGLSNKEILQLVSSTISMLIWIFAIGGPFTFWDYYTANASILVPIVLILWTGLVAPIILGKKPTISLGSD
ncbi:MAG: hypothetical protein ACXACR_17635 [Candidatus Hodarchaeales archaeon]|jgi:hypothetical protein